MNEFWDALVMLLAVEAHPMPKDTEPNAGWLTYSNATNSAQNQVPNPIPSGAPFTTLTEMRCSGHSNPAEMEMRSRVQADGRRDVMRAF